MSKQHFLAKSGQTFGPFTEAEIESLRESGEYERFTWFWDHSGSRWIPIDPPPAAPRLSSRQLEPNHEAQPTSTRSFSEERLRSLSAVCYDHQTVLTGWLSHVTDAGCEFSTESPATAPEFQNQLAILLHLFDQRTGQSMNVSGRVGSAERRNGRWSYRIHWKRCPQILREEAPSAV